MFFRNVKQEDDVKSSSCFSYFFAQFGLEDQSSFLCQSLSELDEFGVIAFFDAVDKCLIGTFASRDEGSFFEERCDFEAFQFGKRVDVGG